jgi:hypothetical protein
LSYFYLVRNWRDVPLILDPYETDATSYQVAKSSESEIVAQIKSDIETAINSGAAKEQYDKTWENKGRATIWALCALMADVCLWSEDYETAIIYCDVILNATSATAPRFMTSDTHASWFTMFNPGNSDESIFELQWDEDKEQFNTLPVIFDNSLDGRTYQYTPAMLLDFYGGIPLYPVATDRGSQDDVRRLLCVGPDILRNSYQWLCLEIYRFYRTHR